MRAIWMHATNVPYAISADLTATRAGEGLANLPEYQSGIGTLRFISSPTHRAITWILGMLGRHLHNPATRHEAAVKPVLRYLSTQPDQGPDFKSKGILAIQCWTDTGCATGPGTGGSITGLLLTMSGAPITWMSAR